MSTTSTRVKGGFGIILAIVVVVVLCIGGWALYWQLHKTAVNKDASINNGSYSRQRYLVDDITTQIQQASIPGIDPGQRKTIVNIICDDAGQLTGSITLSPSSRTFITQECPS